MRKYFVTGYIGEGAKRMFRDLEHQEQIVLLENIIPQKWKRFVFFRFEHFTKGFRHLNWLKKYFYRWYSVFRVKNPKNGCFVFVNSLFVSLYDAEMLERLKEKYPEAKMVLYIVDPMEGFCSEDNWRVISKMDLVYSVHQSDCEKYGFQYHPLVYSASSEIQKKCPLEVKDTDLYYLGSGSDRTAYLARIAKYCKRIGVQTEFHVVSVHSQMTEQEGIQFHTEPLPYEENERMICSSKCILELMHEGFQGATQRYMEAVLYGKKLMTNNERVKELPFYRPEYMQVFHSEEEICQDFICTEEKIDYGYRGEFSPIHLIEEIERQLASKTCDSAVNNE